MYDTQRMMRDNNAETTHTIPGAENIESSHHNTVRSLDTIICDEVFVETEEDVTNAEKEDHDDDLEREMEHTLASAIQ